MGGGTNGMLEVREFSQWKCPLAGDNEENFIMRQIDEINRMKQELFT